MPPCGSEGLRVLASNGVGMPPVARCGLRHRRHAAEVKRRSGAAERDRAASFSLLICWRPSGQTIFCGTAEVKWCWWTVSRIGCM